MEDELYFSLKRITFMGRGASIIVQSSNGPCPLLAVANVLILENRMTIHEDKGVVSYSELVGEICGIVIEAKMRRAATEQTLGGSAASSAALAMESSHELDSILEQLPRLKHGLDLNVLFSTVAGFEFTSELALFDSLGIDLVHGWVADPSHEAYPHVKDLSYNHAMYKIVEYRSLLERADAASSSSDALLLGAGPSLEAFVNDTASQLTYTGLLLLHKKTRERQLLVLFRNNHFSTLFKYGGELYILVTDLGYQDRAEVVWERLDEIDGDTEHVDALFKPSVAVLPQRAAAPPVDIASLDLDSLLPLLPRPGPSFAQAPTPAQKPPPTYASNDLLIAQQMQEEEDKAARYLDGAVGCPADADFAAQFTPEEIEALRREEVYYQQLKSSKPAGANSCGSGSDSSRPEVSEEKKADCAIC